MSLRKIIAPSFYKVINDIMDNKHTHYWLDGGRGSTKSSFISIAIIFGMMKDAENGIYSNCVALRKVKDTLKDSVYEQLCWAIEALGQSQYWHTRESPLTITYLPTGQKILFRSALLQKDIKKIKVNKIPKRIL